MKTKIGIPIGLALVMFLGVFAAMLAFGPLSPQPAHAQSAMRTFNPDPVMPGDPLMVTINFAGIPSGAIGAVTETLPAGFSYVAGSATPAPFAEAINNQEVRFTFTTFPSAFTYTVTSGAVGSHSWPEGQLNVDGTNYPIAASSVMVATAPPPPPRMDVENFSVDNTVKSPGAVSSYRFTFTTAQDLVANEDSITVHFDKDFKGHGSNLSRNHVTVSARHSSDATIADTVRIPQTGAYNPSTDATRDTLSTAHPARHTPAGLTNSSVLANIEYLISVPDMNGGEDGAPGIAAGSTVTVTISPAAGITNATEGGNKGPLGVYTSKQQQLVYGTVSVVRGIGMNDYDANRGKALTVIGKGFQNGTTAAVYLVKTDKGCGFTLADENFDEIHAGATELVSEPVASDDTFQAQFTVTVPPFKPGFGNCIYAQDGNQPPFSAGPVEFELEGLLTISPTSAAVGDKVDITLEDWPDDNIPSGAVTIAGVTQRIIGTPNIGSDGSANFQIEISTDTPSGTDEIKVTTTRENDTKTITISGAILNASPMTAVPNQAITVNGQGFAGDGTINAANDRSNVTLGGDNAALGSSDRNFNNGEAITVDSGGSWSATIIVPITGATTTPGTHTLEVTDSGNRSGSVDITIPRRVLTVEPAEARPGETVMLTGSGFPASNTRSKEHPTPSIEITYDDTLVGTAIPDGSGNIQLSFRVPLEAAIPSTNRVEANYNLPGTSTSVEAFVNHEVPGARISLSMDEGKPGDRVTVTGDGFKAFASIEYIRIGGIEVTPAPRPATDRNGEFTATILVPDLAEGTNSVEVKVGVTAHANFKVLDVSAPSMMMPAAEAMTPADAFADLIAEENLVRVYHFNKHEQNDPDTGGWSLYDTREAFMSLNSIDMIEPGEFYWLMMSGEQLNVTLGTERVDLVEGWNQIRW